MASIGIDCVNQGGRGVNAENFFLQLSSWRVRMVLSLSVTSYAGQVLSSPVDVILDDRGGTIGRQAGCDWVLDDPEGHVSKRHCRIAFASGQYRITDTSTNGVFLNGSPNPLGFGVSAVLRDGDRLSIGSFEVSVRVWAPLGPADRDSADLVGDAPAGGFADERPCGDAAPIGQSAYRTPVPAPGVPGLDGGLLPNRWNRFDDGEAAPAADTAPSPFGRAGLAAATRSDSTPHSMDLVQAFLEGAGLSTELFDRCEPEAVLHAAGERLRELVSGLRKLLAERSRIRGELQIDQSVTAVPAENPLNLSIDDEQALLALLTPACQGYMAPDAVIGRCFDELQGDERALLAGARNAVAEVLASLAPEALMHRVEGRSLLTSTRKAKYWDLYDTEFKKLRQAGENDPDAPLVRVLARASADRDGKP
jgi:type VI secretion system protein ImpI